MLIFTLLNLSFLLNDLILSFPNFTHQYTTSKIMIFLTTELISAEQRCLFIFHPLERVEELLTQVGMKLCFSEFLPFVLDDDVVVRMVSFHGRWWDIVAATPDLKLNVLNCNSTTILMNDVYSE